MPTQTLERHKIDLSGIAKKQLPDPFADVRLEPLSIAGQEIPRLAVVAKDDQGKDVFLADHSTGYKLITNERAAQIVQDVITRSDIGAPEHVETVWNGKRFIDRFRVDSVQFEVNGQDEKILLGIQAVNSYDGAIAFGVEFFALRTKCVNQYHFGNLLGAFTFKHVEASKDEMIEDALEQLRAGAGRFAQLVPHIRRLQAYEIGLDLLLEWHRHLCSQSPAWPDSYTGKVVSALHDEDLTAWGLLNAFTRTTTHEIGGLSGGRLSRLVCDYALELVK